MAESQDIKSTVERIVAEVFGDFFAGLRAQVVEKVVAEVGAMAPAGKAEKAMPRAASADDATVVLNAAAGNVQNATSQSDILSALLDGAAQFAGRAALFVMRGSSAVGWKAEGFEGNIKDINCDTTQGLAARAIQDRMPVSAAAAEFSSELVRSLGNPSDGNALVLPLVAREKVSALLYADRGPDPNGKLDSSALELLVRLTALWLEAVAARRSGAPAPSTDHVAEAVIAPPERVSEPAAHAASVPEPPIAPAERVSESVGALTGTAPAAVAATPAPSVTIAPGDEEVHKKAKRFAKLLVDEIRLYNQAKVAEGRQKRDLYDRLKDDIEKSRTSYEKRYGNTPAAAANYFNQELIRILADNDASLLGGSFSQV